MEIVNELVDVRLQVFLMEPYVRVMHIISFEQSSTHGLGKLEAAKLIIEGQ